MLHHTQFNPRLGQELLEKLETTAEHLCARFLYLADRLGTRLLQVCADGVTPKKFEHSLWFSSTTPGEAVPPQLERLAGLGRALDVLSDIITLQRNPTAHENKGFAQRMCHLVGELQGFAEDKDIGTIGTRCQVNPLESLNLSIAFIVEQHREELSLKLPPLPRGYPPPAVSPVQLSADLIAKLADTSQFLSDWIETRCHTLGAALKTFADSSEPTVAAVRADLHKPGSDSYTLADHLQHLRSMTKALELTTSIISLSSNPGSNPDAANGRRIRHLLGTLQDIAKNPDLGSIGRDNPINKFETIDSSLASIFEQHKAELTLVLAPPRGAR